MPGSRGRADWCAELEVDAERLDAQRRGALAEAWLRDALDVHGQIGALSSLSLQLLALGAPPGLLRAAQRASLDAVRQAELCFGLAGEFAGRKLGPTDRSIAPLPAHPTPTSVALLCLREGCVGQTIAAMTATTAAARCDDETIRGVLRRMAAGATRRAGLCWRYLKWALDGDASGRLSGRLAAEFRAQLQAHPLDHDAGSRPDAWAIAYGRLTHRQRTQIAARAVREIVVPCAEALLTPLAKSLSA